MSSQPSPRPSRRIVAIVLPELLCELAAGSGAARVPRAVVAADPADASEELNATTVLHAVNASARKLGVHPGQTLAEARALSARLHVHTIDQDRIREELGRLAEAALAFGIPVSIQLDGPPAVIGARNWITPGAELEDIFFPQPDWIVDTVHERILPLRGHQPATVQTTEELLRRERRGT